MNLYPLQWKCRVLTTRQLGIPRYPLILIFHVLPDLQAGLSLFILANYHQQGGFPYPLISHNYASEVIFREQSCICSEASQAGLLSPFWSLGADVGGWAAKTSIAAVSSRISRVTANSSNQKASAAICFPGGLLWLYMCGIFFFFFWFFPPLPINLKKKITGFFCQWWEYRKGDCYVGGWTSAECVHLGQGWKGGKDGGEGWGPAKWYFHLWSPGEAWCRKKSKRGSGGLGWETSILVKGLRLWASHSTTLELSVLIYTMSGWPKWLPRSF